MDVGDFIKIILFLIIAFGSAIIGIINKLAAKAKEASLTPLDQLGTYGEEERITPLQPYEPDRNAYSSDPDPMSRPTYGEYFPTAVKEVKPTPRKSLYTITPEDEVTVDSGIRVIEDAEASIDEEVEDLLEKVRRIESISFGFDEPADEHIQQAGASVKWDADHISSVKSDVPVVSREHRVPLMERLAEFSDLEKAIILSEIFNKPPAFRR